MLLVYRPEGGGPINRTQHTVSLSLYLAEVEK